MGQAFSMRRFLAALFLTAMIPYVATLAWTDGGLNFRLHGTVDQENLLHVAESLRIK